MIHDPFLLIPDSYPIIVKNVSLKKCPHCEDNVTPLNSKFERLSNDENNFIERGIIIVPISPNDFIRWRTTLIYQDVYHALKET